MGNQCVTIGRALVSREQRYDRTRHTHDVVALSQRSVPRRLGGPTSAIEMTPLDDSDRYYLLDKVLTLLRNEQTCTPSFFPLQLLLKLTDGTGCLLLLFNYVLHYRWDIHFRPVFFVLLPGISPDRGGGSNRIIETHAKGVRVVLLGGPVRGTEHRRHKELLLKTGFMLQEVNRPPPSEQHTLTHRAYRVTLEKKGHARIIPPKLQCEWINPSDEVTIWLSLARRLHNVCSEPHPPVRQTQSVMVTDMVSQSEMNTEVVPQVATNAVQQQSQFDSKAKDIPISTNVPSKSLRLLPRGWSQRAHPSEWWHWWVKNANLSPNSKRQPLKPSNRRKTPCIFCLMRAICNLLRSYPIT